TEAMTISKSLTLAGSTTSTTMVKPPASLTSGAEIQVASGTILKLSNIKVSGAGSLTGVADNGGTLTATGITVANFATGISITNKGTATVTQSALTNDGVGIALGAGSTDTSTLTVASDSFASDVTGVRDVQATGSVVATNEWWGSVHGPTTPANPGGNGSKL